MAEVGSAYITLLPSAKGFGRGIEREIGGDLDGAGRRGGARMGLGMRKGLLPAIGGLAAPVAAAVAALGIGKIVSDSISSEADFSKTIRQIGVAADASAPQIAALRGLAIQLGADTVFSAGEAADAMLELAKGGFSPAVIQGGALKSVMSLAAAGELQLADAATITSAAMHTFNISAKNSAGIADALAGGANASSADVATLGQALQQVGSGAKNAGLNLNDTVGVLAALADKGIQGSDAGTSLKTMLQRLTPATSAAAGEMKKLGLNFTNAKGEFLPINKVAQQLHKNLSGLSESQRAVALQTIFGSDAVRAATTLYEQGGKGISKYIDATKKQGAAQKLADASMSGTSGAIEKLKGSYDTAKLSIGTFLAPATVSIANGLSGALGGVSSSLSKLKLPKIDLAALFGGAGGKGGLGSFLAPLTGGIQSFIAQVVPAFKTLAGPVKGFIADIVPPLREFATNLVGTLGPGLSSIGKTISGTFIPAVAAILPVLGPIVGFLIGQLGGALIGALKGAIKVIQGVLTVISGIFNVFAALFTGDWSRLWLGVKQIFTGAFQAVVGAVQVFFNIGILKAFRLGFGLLRGIVKGGGTAVVGLFRGGLKLFSDLPKLAWTAIKSVFRNGVSATGTLIRNGVKTYIGIWRAALTEILSVVRGAIVKLVGVIKGLPGKIKSGLTSLPTLLKDAGRKLIQGLIDGIKGMFDSVKGTLGDLTQKIIGWKGPPKKDAKLLTPAGKSIIGSLIKGFESQESKVRTVLLRMTKGITVTFDQASKSIESLATKLGNKLGNAQQLLQDRIQNRADYASQLASSAGLADITSITDPAASDLTDVLKKRLTVVRAFRDNLRKLIKSGLNKTTLQQLADAGPDQAAGAAAALVAGGKAGISQVNQLQGQLTGAAKGLGNTVSGTLFDAGVNAAKGLVKGLESQAKALQKVAGQLGKSIADAVKKALDIHSPSRVMRFIGDKQTGGALALGLEDSIPTIEASARRLATAISTQAHATIPRPSLAGLDKVAATAGVATAGDTYNFNGPMGLDAEEVARRIEVRRRDTAAVAGLVGVR